MKGVPISRYGSDVPGRSGCVAQCGPDFRHQIVQARVGYEGPGPEMLEQFRLRDGFRSPIQKKRQELESSGGKGDGAAVAKNQAASRIELAVSKDDTHQSLERN